MSQDDIDLAIQLTAEAVKPLIHFLLEIVNFIVEAIAEGRSPTNELDIKFAPSHLSIFETVDPTGNGSQLAIDSAIFIWLVVGLSHNSDKYFFDLRVNRRWISSLVVAGGDIPILLANFYRNTA